MSRPGRLILTFVALSTAFGAYIIDWNDSHVHNPNWPPHAKFHHGQMMSMGLALGLTALYFLYRPLLGCLDSSEPLATLHPFERRSVYIGAWLISLYWITQLSAFLYPEAKGQDPEFGEGRPQLYLAGSMLGLVSLGVMMERKCLGRDLKREKSV